MGGDRLSDAETQKLLKRFKIPHVKQFLTKNEKQAARIANKIGYPVILKISSKDIVHKTDVGGVLTGLESAEMVENGFNKIVRNVKRKRPDAKIDGVLVQETANGKEVIIGCKHDAQFGPVIMFGLGGIFVEILKDVSFRVVPIKRKDAKEMIRELKGYKILKGARGQKSVNFEALEDCLLRTSNMIWTDYKGRWIIKELDINPLFVDEKRAVAADVRVIKR